MLLYRRLSPIIGRAHRIHLRTFFSQRVLNQAEITTPGDASVPLSQVFDDSTPDTHPAGTSKLQNKIPFSSSAAAAIAYGNKRRNDPETALNLISDPYVQELKEALQNSNNHRVRTLIAGIIDDDQGDKTTIANQLHYTILTVPLRLLPPRMVVSMLRLVTAFLGQNNLSKKVVARVAALILDSSPYAAQKLLDLIFPSFLVNLQNTKPLETWSGIPIRFVLTSFTLLRWLIPRSQERSVELYKTLVDMGHVPSSALEDDDVKSGKLRALLYASSIRTCGQRGWTELAVEFLNDYLKSEEVSQTLVTDLAMDLVGYLLDTPTENDLYQCCSLIERLHTSHPVPDEIIRDFYTTANQFNFSRPAERLYIFTRDIRKDTSQRHNYPLPHGRSLVWLAKKLAIDEETRRHFESLVEEAHELQQDVLIPASHQPLYLLMVVVEGFGLIGQKLWERWAQGISGEIIRGSPEILVRMTRLTRSMTRKQEERLIVLQNRKPQNIIEIRESNRKLDQITSFANKVLRAFITQHEPLTNADHIILTSLARAHFVLGYVSDGFQCFQILLGRLERPDIVDLNVALTALAESQPRAAFAFVSMMIQYDIEPDETTFGTILHHAMMKDDLDLCTELAYQMKDQLSPDSNFQPFYSMACASVVERTGDTKPRQFARLNTVLKVLRIMDYPVKMFDMHPEVGRSLIQASIGKPELAFDFLELIYKGATRKDFEYCKQVDLIRKALRNAWNSGNMEGSKMRGILYKLLRN